MRTLFGWLCCFGILVLPLAGNTVELRNRLVDHGSPYLAMHGHDPVNWQQWNAESVALLVCEPHYVT